MSATDILDKQITEMREELASANRAIGALHIHLNNIGSLSKDYIGAERLQYEILQAQNVIKRGEGVK